MNTIEKYEDIKVSMLPEKTRETLEKLQKATKNFTIENEKATGYVSAVHSKLSKEKPEALRSKDVKDEPKPEPKKSEPKKPAVKKAVTKKAEPKKEPKPEPTPKPKVTKTQIKTATAKINALKLAIDTDPLLKGLGKTDKERDASRLAQPKGRRTSKVGWKNQYGTSKGGRVYYESRENRSDRKSPEYKSGYPFLEMGGYTHRIDSGIMANGGEMRKNKPLREPIKLEKPSGFDNPKYKDLFKGSYDQRGLMLKPTQDSKTLGSKLVVTKLSNGSFKWDLVLQNGDIYETKTGFSTSQEAIDDYMRTEYAYGGMMAKGGAIENQYEGRTPKDIWNNLSAYQKYHFVDDHALQIEMLKDENYDYNSDKFPKEISTDFVRKAMRSEWEDLDEVVQNRFANHVRQGQYADGGFMADGGQMDKRREYFQGTMSDDALKSILDYEYPNNSFSVEYDSISGTKIYGERADLLNAQTKLKDIYKIKTTLMGENQMGLKYLSAPSQFVYFANGGFMAEGGEMGNRRTLRLSDAVLYRGEMYTLIKRNNEIGLVSYDQGAWGSDQKFIPLSKLFRSDLEENLTDMKGNKFNIPSYDELMKQPYGFMAKGGEMGKIDEVDSDEIDRAFSNFEDFANGGSMKLDWEKADVGDSALVIAENKMGVIVKTYGRRFHLRFPDGSDKTYSAEDLKFFFDEEYAKGGKLKDATYISNRNIKQIVANLDGKEVKVVGENIFDGVYLKKLSKTTPKVKFDAMEIATELSNMAYDIWEKLKIESGSQIYASKPLQIKLAKYFELKGIDEKYLKLTPKQRIVVSEILTDENQHSLNNYLALRGYRGEKEYQGYVRMFEMDKKRPYVINPDAIQRKLSKDGDFKGYSYAKGGEIESTEKLPYKLDKYFIKGAKTIEVPLTQLSPLRARETGIENAEKFMRMAYNGDMERREPISVYTIGKGKYKIFKGNSTYAVAKKNGWKTIYVNVIKNPKMQSNGQKSVFSIAKEIRKDGEKWADAIQRAKLMK